MERNIGRQVLGLPSSVFACFVCSLGGDGLEGKKKTALRADFEMIVFLLR